MQTATLRGDTFTCSIQALTKYNNNAGVAKYSPSTTFTDFLKDIAISSGLLRDNLVALITLAEGIYITQQLQMILTCMFPSDARDSPNDAELRRKLMASASAISEKLAAFKKLILDETKGLRPQLRFILYQIPLIFTLTSLR